MAKALVVYATRTGETENIGNLIAEGLRFSGVDAKVVNVNNIKKAEDLERLRCLCFRCGDLSRGYAAGNENLSCSLPKRPLWKAKSAVLSAPSAGAVKRRTGFSIP